MQKNKKLSYSGTAFWVIKLNVHSAFYNFLQILEKTFKSMNFIGQLLKIPILFYRIKVLYNKS